MPKPSMFNNLLNKIWEGYSDDVGKALIHLGAAGWFFSALAQIGMLTFNENIGKKEKRFLIPQEISDATINVTLYYTICQLIKSFGGDSVEKAKLITKELSSTLKTLNINTKEIQNIAKAFTESKLVETKKNQPLTIILNGIKEILKGEKTNEIEAFKAIQPNISEKILTTIAGNTKEEQINTVKKLEKNFKRFKNGIGVITAVGASVLAGNIITPIVRNQTANYFQKKLTKSNEIKPAIRKEYPIYFTQTSSTFNKFKI